MVRNSGYRLPDADIDLAFQLAILRHCNEYGAECAGTGGCYMLEPKWIGYKRF